MADSQHEEIVPTVGEAKIDYCLRCHSMDLQVAAIYAITSQGSRQIGGYAVCANCGWSPYADADQVMVRRADLDLVMNGAGDATRTASYPAACQRIRDALQGGQRG